MKSKKEKPERESHHTRHSIKSREKTYLLASSWVPPPPLRRKRGEETNQQQQIPENAAACRRTGVLGWISTEGEREERSSQPAAAARGRRRSCRVAAAGERLAGWSPLISILFSTIYIYCYVVIIKGETN
jgi:hypothetical protein